MQWMTNNKLSQTEMNTFMKWVMKWQSLNGFYRCPEHKRAFDIIEEPCFQCMEEFVSIQEELLNAQINKTPDSTKPPVDSRHKGELPPVDRESGKIFNIPGATAPRVPSAPEVHPSPKAPRNRGPRSKE